MRFLDLSKILCSLLVILAGCSPFQKGQPEVAVEEIVHNEVGVSLEPMKASLIPLQVDQSVESSVGISLRTIVQRFSRTTIPKEARYYFISGEKIRENLRKKLGVQFSRLTELYESAISNQRPMELVPELGMVYQFAVTLDQESDLKDEWVSFPLKDALSGRELILKKESTVLSMFWGNPRLSIPMEGSDTPTIIADLTEPSDRLRLFRLGEESWVGFHEESGSNLFLVQMARGEFKIHPLSSSIPKVSSASRVVSVRATLAHLKVLGMVPTSANSILFFFIDSDRVMKRIFLMDGQFVFRDLSSNCLKLAQSGLLPLSEMVCTARPSVEPVGPIKAQLFQ